MSIRKLLVQNRSFRRFEENHRIERSTLVELVDLTRMCPSSANRQPLRFMLAFTPEQTAAVFPHLRWAGALTDWPGPSQGERPAAYVIILRDAQVPGNYEFDAGIAAQSLLLAAVEQGLGGCMIASINHPNLRSDLHIPEHYDIVMVVALGKPAETVVLENADEMHGLTYWRDSAGVHHVPKRPLSELIVDF